MAIMDKLERISLFKIRKENANTININISDDNKLVDLEKRIELLEIAQKQIEKEIEILKSRSN
ncbi:MAG: hypothetical protein RSD51_03315 [Malacoplasma sp.]